MKGAHHLYPKNTRGHSASIISARKARKKANDRLRQRSFTEAPKRTGTHKPESTIPEIKSKVA